MPTTQPIHSSAQSFLTHLSLPHNPNEESTPHPSLAHSGEGVFELPHAHRGNQYSGPIPSPPPIGPVSYMELHNDSMVEWIKTAVTMTAPSLAMLELWLRLFAVVVGPVCIGSLIYWEWKYRIGKDDGVSTSMMVVAILAVVSSAVLFTDSLYVYEYGREFGGRFFVLSSILAVRLVGKVKRLSRDIVSRHDKGKEKIMSENKATAFSVFIWGLIAATTIVFLRSDGGHAIQLGIEKIPHLAILSGFASAATTAATLSDAYNPLLQVSDPGIDLPTIQPGFYHSNNPLIQAIANHWPESSRSYNVSNGATPYLVNGDQRTGIPFLVNKIEEQEYIRVYVRNPYDDEPIALDIAFPYSKREDHNDTTLVHHLDKPVYLILHGLNGGSHEEYVKDFVLRRRSEGSTVIVMIARGMMDTTMRGWNVFHGARTGDVDIAARAVRRGLEELAGAHDVVERQLLAGVGYSMGAIILSNYMARSGSHCALDAAVAVSGGLDMRQQLNFRRSMRLWQPMLTFGLRDDILLGKYARHYRHRLTREQFMSMLRVTSISHLDVEAIVNYNSFDNLVHYYSEMSAMGDRKPEFRLFDANNEATCDNTNSESSWGRIANVSVPFLVVQALDDPLVGWRTVGTENVQGLADSGSGNTMLLLTKAGGHVGWPQGTNPKKEGWKWMNDVGRDFVLAVVAAKQELN